MDVESNAKVDKEVEELASAVARIELYAPEPMTPHLEKLIAEVEADLRAGQVSKPFTNAEDFTADLER